MMRGVAVVIAILATICVVSHGLECDCVGENLGPMVAKKACISAKQGMCNMMKRRKSPRPLRPQLIKMSGKKCCESMYNACLEAGLANAEGEEPIPECEYHRKCKKNDVRPGKFSTGITKQIEELCKEAVGQKKACEDVELGSCIMDEETCACDPKQTLRAGGPGSARDGAPAGAEAER